MHFILHDEINSGKSTYVLDLVRGLAEKFPVINGWITPPYFENNEKIGQDIVIIEHGNISELIPFTRLHQFDSSFKWRKYHFNSAAFEMCENISTDCRLFIMDEIGPLELDDEKGFFAASRRAAADSPATLVVIRKNLVQELSKICKLHNSTIYTLSSKASLETDLNNYLDAVRR